MKARSLRRLNSVSILNLGLPEGIQVTFRVLGCQTREELEASPIGETLEIFFHFNGWDRNETEIPTETCAAQTFQGQ